MAKKPRTTTFKRKVDAWKWLVGQDWKISQAVFYADCAADKLKPTSRGVYTLRAVQVYAETHLQKIDGTSPKKAVLKSLAEQVAYQKQRLAEAMADERILRVQKMRGLLVDREKVWQELAARAQVLRNGCDNWRFEVGPKLCDHFGIPREKVPLVIQFLEEELENLFAQYGDRQEFEAAVFGEDEDA